ncbi:DNA repair protein RecO [Thalassotalea sp. LPB0316]|uniref:DNA repair protein RecO n=1 Tax=Thalassotalea sp. LPB0316 TaxID=2769490 RepID=UPI0018672A9F|nr:DNA repair protein RecO [Thalassotalea sp. LPB0316]QOL25580.1 DNA repair protein RecO [Thalassotalea sp. LPB0316]
MMFETQQAYLLHSRPFKEHQLIIDLLTQRDGKVSAVISSGHSLKANKRGILQPFSLFSLQLSGRHQLKKASQLESCHQHRVLVGNSLYSGLYINELLVRLLPECVPCELLFEQYGQAIESLNKSDTIEPILRTFEMQLLDELGFSLNFTTVEESSHQYWQFIAEQGFVEANQGSQLPIYQRSDLLNIAQANYQAQSVLTTHKVLMRQMINHLLGHKPLKSRELFMARDKKQ